MIGNERQDEERGAFAKDAAEPIVRVRLNAGAADDGAGSHVGAACGALDAARDSLASSARSASRRLPNRHGRIPSAKVEVLRVSDEGASWVGAASEVGAGAAVGASLAGSAIPKLPDSLCVWDMPGGRSLLGHVAYNGELAVARAGEAGGAAIAGAGRRAAAVTLAGALGAFSVTPASLALASEPDAGADAASMHGVSVQSAIECASLNSEDADAMAASMSAVDGAASGKSESTGTGGASGTGAGSDLYGSAATGEAAPSGGADATTGASAGFGSGATVSGNATGFEGASSSTLDDASSSDGVAGSSDEAAADCDLSAEGADGTAASADGAATSADSAAFAFAATADSTSPSSAGGASVVALDNEPATLADDTPSGTLTATSQEELQSAIDSTSGNGTVYITADIELAGPIVVPAGSSLTINLYGHALTGASGQAIFGMSGGSLKVLSDTSTNAGATNSKGTIDASACSALIDNSTAGTTTVEFAQGDLVDVKAKTLFANSDGWKYTLGSSLTLSESVEIGDGSSLKVASGALSKAELASSASPYALVLSGGGSEFTMERGYVRTSNSALLIDSESARAVVSSFTVDSGDAVTCKSALGNVTFAGSTVAKNGKVLNVLDGASEGSISMGSLPRFSDISVMDYLADTGKAFVYAPSNSYKDAPYSVKEASNNAIKNAYGKIDGIYCSNEADFDALWDIRAALGGNCEVEAPECTVTFKGLDGDVVRTVKVFKKHCLGGSHSSLAGGVDNLPPTDEEMAEIVGADYAFDGWCKVGGDGTVLTRSEILEEKVTFDTAYEAKCTPVPKFSVGFSYRMLASDGVTDAEDDAAALAPESVSVNVRKGETIGDGVPVAPEIEGYEFIGWFYVGGDIRIEDPADVVVFDDVQIEGCYKAVHVEPVEPPVEPPAPEPPVDPEPEQPVDPEPNPDPDPDPTPEPDPDPEPGPDPTPEPENPTDPIDPEQPEGPVAPTDPEGPNGTGGSEGNEGTGPSPELPDGDHGHESESGGSLGDGNADPSTPAPAAPSSGSSKDAPPLTSIAIGGAGVPVPGVGWGRLRDGEVNVDEKTPLTVTAISEQVADGVSTENAEDGSEGDESKYPRDAESDSAGSQAAGLSALLETFKMAAVPLAIAGGFAAAMLAVMSASRHAAQAGAAIAKSAASAGPKSK